MTKVIKALLAMKFPSIDVNSLMEVVEATPNPTLATEILCGLYEAPVIPEFKKCEDGVKTFKSYDKWNNQVVYSYEYKKKIYINIPKEIDAMNVTFENYKTFETSYASGKTKDISILTGEIEIHTSYESLGDWKRNPSDEYALMA